jgi:hypothetical protein
MRWVFLLLVALPSVLGSSSLPRTRIPFEVAFDTVEPLGLRLDASLTVLGFSRKPDGSPSHAEASGLVRPSDTLVSVNGKSVVGMSLQRAVMAIRDAELPKVLAFLPSHPGEDREAEVREQFASLEVRDVPSPTPSRPVAARCLCPPASVHCLSCAYSAMAER